MVIRNFNLLLSTSRGDEDDACSETWYLLGKLGDREASVEKTDISGLIVAKTTLDPFKVVEDLRRMLNDRPEEFRFILRVIPVEMVVRTGLEEIEKAASELSHKILKDETFRVTIEKRHSELSVGRIIEAVAAGIERKVDLGNPSKIIQIEVLGRSTGVSVIRPADILSVAKEKTS